MLGARIAALRRRAGMSQADLALELRCSSSAVGMYEQGRREPAADLVVKLARIFGVTTDYLLTGKPVASGDRDALRESLHRCLDGTPGSTLSREEVAVLLSALLMEP
jgi:transcriptional regulator with XRE-family HTH domain